MSTPTREYLIAKAQLCRKVAINQLCDLRYKEALQNIQRASDAMAYLRTIEGEGEK